MRWLRQSGLCHRVGHGHRLGRLGGLGGVDCCWWGFVGLGRVCWWCYQWGKGVGFVGGDGGVREASSWVSAVGWLGHGLLGGVWV